MIAGEQKNLYLKKFSYENKECEFTKYNKKLILKLKNKY